MKRNIFIKLFLLLFLGVFLVSISACNKAEEPKGEDPTTQKDPSPEPQVVKEEISLPYSSLYKVTKAYHDSYYSDDYFKAKSFIYNQRLAIASLAVAMSSYPIKDEDTYGHTKELYTKLGFEKFYKNEYADQNSQKDALGVVMASKKMETYTLLSVGARGSDYGNEWTSNFEVGNDGQYASGFNVASNVVLKTINDYISNNNIKGNVKIWATGYSRAGAAVNLAFGKIDKALIDNNKIIPNVNYTKDDLFVYTFEAPAGKVGTVKGEAYVEKLGQYNNIFNLISLDDIVPMVMPRKWGFVRYGLDLYLPSKITELDYDNYLVQLKTIINSTYDVETIGEYKLDTFSLSGDKINYTFGKYVDMLVNDLFDEIGSLENYVNDYEKTVSKIVGLAISNPEFRNALKEFFDQAKFKILAPAYARLSEPDIDKAVDAIFAAVEEEYGTMLKKPAFNAIDKDEFTLCLKKLMKVLINVIKKEGGLTALAPLMTWASSIIYPHIPEVEYASLLAMENGKTKYDVSSEYFIVKIDADSDFTIEIAGKAIVENKDKKLTTKMVCEKLDNKYIIYLPLTRDLKIDATDFKIYIMSTSSVEPQLTDIHTIIN